jgi:hypothetical protein
MSLLYCVSSMFYFRICFILFLCNHVFLTILTMVIDEDMDTMIPGPRIMTIDHKRSKINIESWIVFQSSNRERDLNEENERSLNRLKIDRH